MKHSKQLLVYFGRHKCASIWIAGIISEVCHVLRQNNGYVNGVSDAYLDFNKDPNKYVKENKIDFLSYNNANNNIVTRSDDFKGFHVVRDPRDICVSAYFSHLYSHPTDRWSELERHRNELKKLSKAEGLLLDMKFTSFVFEQLYNWDYSNHNIFNIKMESLIRNPYEKFMEIFLFLGILDERPFTRKRQVSFYIEQILFYIVQRLHYRGLIPFRHSMRKIHVEKLLFIIYNNRFSKKAEGRNVGGEDIKSHYRKGVPGDWINHFLEEHIKYFKTNYNELLIKMGYESKDDW